MWDMATRTTRLDSFNAGFVPDERSCRHALIPSVNAGLKRLERFLRFCFV